MAKFKINGYKNLETLTEGGQGILYLANKEDSSEEIKYVVKRLKNLKRLTRFKKEIESISKLKNPNVVEIIEHNINSDFAYYVMPYFPNGNLSNLDFSNWSILEKLNYFKIICEAIQLTHQNGIIHRDLKPENILIDQNNQPVISDYGICFLIFDEDERATSTSEAVGPRFYMAPELEDGKIETILEKSDVYSLGKILYWLISEKKIFSREKHRNEQYDLTKINPTRLDLYLIFELLDKMVTSDEKLRMDNLNEVNSELNKIINKIMNNYNTIDYKAPQKCIYCGEGNYQLRVWEGIGSKFRTEINNLGFDPRGEATMHVYVCDACGNVQLFNKDVKTVFERWNKNSK